MKFALGADHAGVELKSRLSDVLRARGIEVVDFGTDASAPADYPDKAAAVARAVASGEADRGLLVCGTGVGMAMSANRFAGVRAVNPSDSFTTRMSRAHNDANVLALGARALGAGQASELLEVFLDTPFDGDRHTARVAKIDRVVVE
ncbi:MAG: ribose 5-phosphate isomerase B [Acidobacteria bacterium]|nr:ribose 5-phosphate isomerase B [Acidobacteriota bacterium]